MVKNNQDNDFNGNKLTNIDSITIVRGPSSDNEVSNKKYIDDELDKNTILTFTQTLQNYLKESVGNDTYIITKYNKIQIIDHTIIRKGNGQYLIPRWKVVCNDKNNNALTTNFIRASKTTSPTSHSGATSLPPIGKAFIYVETSSNNHGHERVFVSWERTDIIQFTKNTFYYNSFSSLTNESLK